MEELTRLNEKEEYGQAAEMLLQIPGEELDQELQGELARALNNAERYEEALEVLDAIGAEGRGDAKWFFRRGYALHGLERFAEAREDFEKAAELDPEDPDAPEFIRHCSFSLAYPAYAGTFRERVETFWERFAQEEEELRRLIGEKEMEGAMELTSELLRTAFSEAYFEIGCNGRQYELILTAEGMKQRLFRLEYWKKHAPDGLLDRWKFTVGRPQCPDPEKSVLRMFDTGVCGADAAVWPEVLDGGAVGLNIYCEALMPLMEEDENKAYSLMAVLIDQCIGELSAIKNVGYLELLRTAEFSPEVSDGDVRGPVRLCDLQGFIDSLRNKKDGEDGDGGMTADGGPVSDGEENPDAAQSPCGCYTAYQMEPENGEYRLRGDVFIGSTCCIPVLNEFYGGRTDIVDENVRDGAVFGFLYYNNDKVPRSEMVPFRAAMEDEISAAAAECGEVIGGATGVDYSYIDCICYDLGRFLEVAGEVMNRRDLDEIVFHVFRGDCGGLNLKKDPAE